MDIEQVIQSILEKEWALTLAIGDGSGQNEEDRLRFAVTRTAHLTAWKDEIAESYLEDLNAAEAEGINLLYEKFMRMLVNTAPQDYEKVKDSLRPVSEEKQKLVDDIWQELYVETVMFERSYPALSLGGRPLTAAEEEDIPSVETFQKCELMSFSVKTLELLKAYQAELKAAGKSLTMLIQENTIKAMGFKDLAEAEKMLIDAAMKEMDSGCCCCNDIN